MKFKAIGLNYKSSPLKLREQLYFSKIEIRELLNSIKQDKIIQEALILSTCNRTEFYTLSDDGTDVTNYINSLLIKYKNIKLKENRDYLYIYLDIDAIRHLMSVATGIDSMVLGEPQIFGQVKEAYKLACDCSSNGPFLNKLLHLTFRIGKQARINTRIGYGSVSVSYVAIESVKKFYADLAKYSALLIGAGDTGKLVTKHIVDAGIGKLFITNRTISKAKELASQFQGKIIPFNKMKNIMTKVDLVISSTSSPDYIITKNEMKDIMSQCSHRPLFIIDIAVPRDFDPEIGKLNNVFLKNIDDLQKIADKNLEKRKKEIPKVQAIIENGIKSFLDWQKTYKLNPVIKSLIEKMENIRKEEIEKNKNLLSKQELKRLNIISKNIIKKILHSPINKLKELKDDIYHGKTKLELITELFDLKDESSATTREKN